MNDKSTDGTSHVVPYVQGVGIGLSFGAFIAVYGAARPVAAALGVVLISAGYGIERLGWTDTETDQ